MRDKNCLPEIIVGIGGHQLRNKSMSKG